MPKFLVRVRRVADDTEQILSYKGYTFIEDDIDDVTGQKKFELIGEVDSNGNLIPGSPNLQPQHRTKAPVQNQPSVAPVANAEANKADVKTSVPQEQKRRGRRPAEVKLQETTA